MESQVFIPWDHFEEHATVSPFEILTDAQAQGKIVEIKAADVNGEIGYWRLIPAEVTGDANEWSVPATDIMSGTTMPHVIPQAFTRENMRMVSFIEEDVERETPLKPNSTDVMEIVGPYEISYIEVAAAGTPDFLEDGPYHVSNGGSVTLTDGWMAIDGVFGPEDLVSTLSDIAAFMCDEVTITIRSASVGLNSLPIELTVGRDGLAFEGHPVQLTARAV